MGYQVIFLYEEESLQARHGIIHFSPCIGLEDISFTNTHLDWFHMAEHSIREAGEGIDVATDVRTWEVTHGTWAYGHHGADVGWFLATLR